MMSMLTIAMVATGLKPVLWELLSVLGICWAALGCIRGAPSDAGRADDTQREARTLCSVGWTNILGSGTIPRTHKEVP